MRSWLLDYFTVSKKERTGMIFLIFLIVLIWLLPRYFGRSDTRPVPGIVPEINGAETTREKTIADSIGVKRSYRLFYFDPNTISDGQWKQMGLSEKNVRTIRNYLSKGGQFRRAEDIRKIYGLREDVTARLEPFVIIKDQRSGFYEKDRSFPSGGAGNKWRSVNDSRDKWNNALSGDSRGKWNNASSDDSRSKWSNPSSVDTRSKWKSLRQSVPMMLELNRADTGALIDLPGIGPTLAKRIIVFREKCGGFYSLHQLAEVYGLKDSVFQLLRPQLSVDPLLIRRLHINSLGQDSLQQHPYINYSEARAIVKYRSQHGPFRSASDLLQVALITEAWLSRIGPYLDYGLVE